jgi:hypothetical protein
LPSLKILYNTLMDAGIDTSADDTITPSSALLISLQQRANTLLSEFRAFQAQLQASGLSKSVESRIFRRGVEAEAKSLETFARKQSITLPSGESTDEAEIREAKQTHSLRSSNLPFYEAVWTAAKRCNGVRALGRRLYWEKDGTSLGRVSEPPRKQNKKHMNSALVDIVADNGLKWVKISIVSAKRLLFEMAKEGWEDYGAESDEDGSPDEETTSRSEAKLDIVRLAEDLRDAARTTRIRYKHPQVKFILPSITEGEEDAIDAVLTQIRATGAIVECGPPTLLNSLSDLSLTPASKFDHMLPSPNHPTLTETINIDCTILLALISDISHVSRGRLPPSPSNKSGIYHTAILKQIESEEHSPLLPHEVYPILRGRKLVCTSLAAQRMREIVDIMATPTEAERARILLGEGESEACEEAVLRGRWRGLSEHGLPDDILLPIIVEEFIFPDSELSATETALPIQMANKLYGKMDLSPINASVFIYGWHHNIVTMTSNRVVATGIERVLNGLLDEIEISGKDSGVDGFEGPKMYICETARSLVGKEKGHGIRP